MQVITDKNTFGGRLYGLFQDNGYDFKKSSTARTVINAMIKRNLIADNQASVNNMKKCFSKDLKCTLSTPNIYTSTLKIYCDFLGCSADYLLGIIDAPTYEITDIKAKTNLSPAAVKNLLQADTDTKIVIDRLLAGNYIKSLPAALKSFFSIGAAVEVKTDNIDSSTIKEFEKAADNIRIDILRNKGADIVHNLAYDKQVGKHFIEKSVDVYQGKQIAIYKKATNNNKAVIDNIKVSAANMKKELIDSFNNAIK